MNRILLSLISVSCILLFSTSVFSHNQTVVVPLGGSKGDAGAGHVLMEKTFSNDTQKGITGTRPYSPVADTGISTSLATGDDGYYRIYVGESVANRFGTGVDLGPGLQDKLTGLYWESSPPTSLYTWANALSRCENKVTSLLHLSWNDWRLPTINELQTIIDRDNYNNALPSGLNINNVQSTNYWTSTPYATYKVGGDLAWQVHLGIGTTGVADRDTSAYTVCVRGQFFFPIFVFDQEKEE